jgi:hypothetical protein
LRIKLAVLLLEDFLVTDFEVFWVLVVLSDLGVCYFVVILMLEEDLCLLELELLDEDEEAEADEDVGSILELFLESAAGVDLVYV